MCAVIRGFQFEPIMSVFLLDSIGREDTLKISSVVVVDGEGGNISDTVWFLMVCWIHPQSPVKAQNTGKVETQRGQENLGPVGVCIRNLPCVNPAPGQPVACENIPREDVVLNIGYGDRSKQVPNTREHHRPLPVPQGLQQRQRTPELVVVETQRLVRRAPVRPRHLPPLLEPLRLAVDDLPEEAVRDEDDAGQIRPDEIRPRPQALRSVVAVPLAGRALVEVQPGEAFDGPPAPGSWRKGRVPCVAGPYATGFRATGPSCQMRSQRSGWFWLLRTAALTARVGIFQVADQPKRGDDYNQARGTCE